MSFRILPIVANCDARIMSYRVTTTIIIIIINSTAIIMSCMQRLHPYETDQAASPQLQ